MRKRYLEMTFKTNPADANKTYHKVMDTVLEEIWDQIDRGLCPDYQDILNEVHIAFQQVEIQMANTILYILKRSLKEKGGTHA